MYLKFIKHPVIPADPREAFIIRYPPRNLHTRLRRLNEPSVLQHPRLLKAAVTCGHALLSLNIRGGGEGVVVVWGGGEVSSAGTLPEICCEVLSCLGRLDGYCINFTTDAPPAV